MPVYTHIISRSRLWPRASPVIEARQGQPEGSRSEAFIIAAVVVASILCATLILYYTLRYLRLKHLNPRYVPTTWLKRTWEAWEPHSVKRFHALQASRQGDRRRPSQADTLSILPHSEHGRSTVDLPGVARAERDATGVDRQTSQRSVITLPAYSADVRPTEQIIGRAGERGGVDTVVELPETAEEEEERREEEMQSLYQIRQARRQERAEREERRRLRHEARDRGDTAAVEELRLQARAAREAREDGLAASEALITDHRARGRKHHISSVSYSDVGVARHDGSRVRAQSGDSDRRPLIDGAATLGRTESRDHSSDARVAAQLDSAGSRSLLNEGHTRSVSSLSRFITPDVSDDERSSMDHDFVPTPSGNGSRSTSISAVHPTISTGSSGQVSAAAVATSIAAGSAEWSPQPPSYEPARYDDEGEAPAYESPNRTNAPRLPGLSRLPSITITPFTPSTEDANRERRRF